MAIITTAPVPATGAASPTVRGPHAVALGLFLLVWLSCIWFGSNPYNPNTATRLFAAISLVEDGDATIDQFQTDTLDKAEFNGRIYSDKNPGVTLMAMPAVWIADRVTGERARDHTLAFYNRGLARYIDIRLQLAVATSSALLLGLASVLLLDLATGITGNPRAGLVTALAYALGTPAWGWSTTLFGHAPVGALLVIAAWAVWRGTSGMRELARWRYPLLLGLALGWAIVIELAAALPAAVIGAWAIWCTRGLAPAQRWRLAAMTAAAGIVALLPMLAYNQIAFGSWFKLGYQGVVGYDGMKRGLFGLTYPHAAVLGEILVGLRRGLVFVAPILLLAPIGLVQLIRRPATRDLGIMASALAVTLLLYNASYFYWDGGYSTGPRHAMPAMAFLALGIAPLWQSWGRNGRRTIAALLGLSIVLNLAIAAADVTAPAAYAFPIADPILRKVFDLEIRTFASDWWGWPTWRGLALYLVVALPLTWFLFRATSLSERRGRPIQATVA
ncbi:hypothetical protein [Sphingomonas sp. PB4P5]|uniref:hypothetical protein n=1 Tax=Parasphingomonas puruogangriensis TaxID=3096155 RepID=UPI002FC676A3